MSSQTRRRHLILAMVWLFTFLIATAHADVTTTGSVTNPPPLEGGSFSSTTVTVGDQNAGIDSILGALRVDAGTDLLLERLIIGDERQHIGDVEITGAGTLLDLDSSSASSPALQVGDEGTGFLSVFEQAVVTVSNSNGNIALGRDGGSAGFVLVDGTFTQLSFGDNLIVGDSGFGDLKLTDGALLYTSDFFGSSASIGASQDGVGVVELEGPRTLWLLPQTVSIGTVGAGTLRIVDGATADGADGTNAQITVGERGSSN